MGGIKANFFRNGDLPDPNTFIGGLGASVTDAATLESMMGVSSGSVQGFHIVGTEIRCFIENNYTILQGAFSGNTDITSFYDADGKVGTLQRTVFANSSIIEVNFPNVTLVRGGFSSAGTFLNASSLSIVTLPKLSEIQDWGFANCTSLPSTLNFPLLTNVQRDSFRLSPPFSFVGNLPLLTFLELFAFNASGLTSFTATNLTYLPAGCFVGCSNLVSINLPNITTHGGITTYVNCALLTSLNYPNLLTIEAGDSLNNRGFLFSSSVETFEAPLLTSCGAYAFAKSDTLTTLTIPNCTDLGGAVTDTGALFEINASCVITVPIALQTNNGGGVDGDIAYAISRGCTIIYV